LPRLVVPLLIIVVLAFFVFFLLILLIFRLSRVDEATDVLWSPQERVEPGCIAVQKRQAESRLHPVAPQPGIEIRGRGAREAGVGAKEFQGINQI
jgi:hypothetical protein